MVAARFERHVEGCAPGLGGILKGHDLGVRASEAGMMAQPDDPTLADQDRANHGIGLDGPSSSFRLGQGQIHPGKVGSAHAGESSRQFRADQKGDESGDGGVFGAVVSFFGAAGTGGGGLGPCWVAAEPVDTDVPGRAGLNSSLGKRSR